MKKTIFSICGVIFSGLAVTLLYQGPPDIFNSMLSNESFIQEKQFIMDYYSELDRRTNKGYENAYKFFTRDLREQRKITHEQNSYRDFAIGYFPTVRHKILDITHIKSVRGIEVFSIQFVAEERYPNLKDIPLITEASTKYNDIIQFFNKYFVIPDKKIFLNNLKKDYKSYKNFEPPNFVLIALKHKLHVKDYNVIKDFTDIRISQYFTSIGILKDGNNIVGIDCVSKCPRESDRIDKD